MVPNRSPAGKPRALPMKPPDIAVKDRIRKAFKLGFSKRTLPFGLDGLGAFGLVIVALFFLLIH